jgi:hypothetical protein
LDLIALAEYVGLADVVLELLIEDVPVLELVVVFDELIDAVAVRELNALKVWAGEDDEVLERVALFVLEALFRAVVVDKADVVDK